MSDILVLLSEELPSSTPRKTRHVAANRTTRLLTRGQLALPFKEPRQNPTRRVLKSRWAYCVCKKNLDYAELTEYHTEALKLVLLEDMLHDLRKGIAPQPRVYNLKTLAKRSGIGLRDLEAIFNQAYNTVCDIVRGSLDHVTHPSHVSS